MKGQLTRLLHSAAVAIPLATLSAQSYAGANIIVNLGAVSGPQSVPVASHSFLIAVGVLMMVVAYRFFTRYSGYQKMLSLAVFLGATAVAGLGTERTLASYFMVPVPAEDPVCSGGQTALSLGGSVFFPAEITNNCATMTLEVLSYENFDVDCPNGPFETRDADIGDTIAPGQSVLSNTCAPQ